MHKQSYSFVQIFEELPVKIIQFWNMPDMYFNKFLSNAEVSTANITVSWLIWTSDDYTDVIFSSKSNFLLSSSNNYIKSFIILL